MAKSSSAMQRNGGNDIEESDSKPLGDTSNGGSGSDPITVQPFNPAPQTMQDALGKRGSSIPVMDAMAGANPFYNGGTQGDFSANCQRAVAAYEMRRRGYDVMALPTYAGDRMPSAGNWEKVFNNAKRLNVGASSPQKAQANLESQMKSYGNGARGIVGIPGHVFNVENVGGKIRYIDAQTNTVYNSKGVFSRLGKRGSQSVTLIRTDKLGINPAIRQSVTPVTNTTQMISERRKRRTV